MAPEGTPHEGSFAPHTGRRRWEEPDTYDLLPLNSNKDWLRIEGRYPGPQNGRVPAFWRCLQVARANGARTVVVETGYQDRDFRSEFAGFYSKIHADVSRTVHRLHFFTSHLKMQDVPSLPDSPGYIGYIIVRPIRGARVGRTMLPPPPGIRSYVRALAPEPVNLFGQELRTLPSSPFMQQDTQLGRCAHVAAWMCHRLASLRGEVGRIDVGDLSAMSEVSTRSSPSQGLTMEELARLVDRGGLNPAHYPLLDMQTSLLVPWEQQQPIVLDNEGYRAPDGLWNREIIRIACRYLNGGLPVIVGTRDHAFVLVGYRRMRVDGRTWVVFIRNDDQWGPYLAVDDPFNDIDLTTGRQYGAWTDLLVPRPDRLWLPGEPVEATGAALLQSFAEGTAGRVPAAARLGRLILDKSVAVRVYPVASNRFKTEADRLPKPFAREIRLQRLPRYVWVTELVNRAARDRGEVRAVVGEAIFDATSSETDPAVLAIHVPGAAMLDRLRPNVLKCSDEDYVIGGIGPV